MGDADSGVNGAPAWHSMDIETVAAEVGTGRQGLAVAEARARLERHGKNVIETVPPPGRVEVLLNQFRSPVIYILVIAALVTLVLEEFIDAGVIAAVLILNAAIGYSQERRAEESVRALMHLVPPLARVVREGREWEVDSRDLVVGDVVLLESGARVPADLRMESVNSLLVDESLLTGESVAVEKHSSTLGNPDLLVSDRQNMAHAGSLTTSGRGRGWHDRRPGRRSGIRARGATGRKRVAHVPRRRGPGRGCRSGRPAGGIHDHTCARRAPDGSS